MRQSKHDPNSDTSLVHLNKYNDISTLIQQLGQKL